MADTTISSHGRRARVSSCAGLLLTGAWLILAAVVAVNMAFFARHAVQVLSYRYPLDYGEGPLLAQAELLHAAASLHQLYGPLDQAPYLVVNYPPVYLLTTLLTSTLAGNLLLAGRLVSLVSALTCVAALMILTTDDRRPTTGERRFPCFRLVIVLAFLALPIVREWALLMRVDMLGVALGLWGLVALRAQFRVQSSEFRIQSSKFKVQSSEFNIGVAALEPGSAPDPRPLNSEPWHNVWLVVSALLLTASLFTKPSLLAAPVAAVTWLLLRDWRRGILLAGMLALFGSVVFGWLAAGSHFFEHVVVANANAWQADLAVRFWRGQLAVHGPLFAAGALSLAVAIHQRRGQADRLRALAVPLAYTLVGALGAAGVGKVGAYLNYFLELYVGLIWLVVLAFGNDRPPSTVHRPPSTVHQRLSLTTLFPAVTLLLVAAALVRYYPTWSETDTRLAGLIEGQNPARLVIGQRGVWQDLRRERLILDTLARTNAALVAEVQAAGAPILTDIPGVAAQAGQVSRLQAFEHSQLPQWDQRALRLDLANGRVPLAVIDYLGNWLRPEVIALLRHRYAQDGSRGTFDLYRPLDPGPRVAADIRFADGLQITGYHLVPPSGKAGYHAGELVVVTLDWLSRGQAAGDRGQPKIPRVVLSLHSLDGQLLVEDVQPLVYGAVAPREFPAEGVQHMQPLRLPDALKPGDYQLEVALRDQRGLRATSQILAQLYVAAQTGALLPGWLGDRQREYVPAPLLAASAQLGPPLTPVVPFVGFLQQCFARGCLRWQHGAVVRVPVGAWLSAGDLGAVGAFDGPQISAGFRRFYEASGGVATLGTAVTNEFRSGERMVQYTQFVRLERPIAGGDATLGNVGVDVLRLPAGTPYRWP